VPITRIENGREQPAQANCQFRRIPCRLRFWRTVKDGIKVHLPEQPFRLLSILLEVPGEVVSRDELRRRLWPEDTHVDFDRSLNTAASKLREVLADGSGSSRDIETLPKRGYRFITPVSGVVHLPSPSERDKQKLRSRPILRSYVLLATILLVSAFGLAYFYWHSTFRVPPIKRTVRLTNDDFTKSPELATDGPRLYFSAWKGERSVLAQVATAGGDTELIPTPEIGTDASACVRGMSPDNRNLLVVTGKQRVADEGHALWSVGVSPLSSRRVGSIMANDADWSPDGQKIVYATRNQIWISEADGARPRKVAEQGGLTAYPRWSPDGQIIRFSTLAWYTFEQTIWAVTAGGGSAHRLFPNWAAEHWGGQWTSDGNYYVFNSESNIWAVSERPRWFRNVRTPVQLTFGPLTYYAPLPSTDGRTIYTVGEIRRGELLRYDREQSRFVPSFPGLSA
jgi:DNA-binding winged helix-turn-helix (wHTH) protein